MSQLILQVKEFFIGSVLRKRIAFSLAGALAGYAYYYFIGCSSGSCPITGNPWISTAYGAFTGFILTAGDRKKNQSQDSE